MKGLVLSNREQEAMGRLSSYEGGKRPGFNVARRPGFDGNYFGLNAQSSEGDIRAFQGLLTYQVQLVNANAAVRTARLTPALLGESAPGLIAAGAFNDIDGNAGLTGSTSSPGTIQELIRFISYNPTKLLGMKLSSTDTNQMEQSLNVYVKSPFRQLEQKIVPLGQYNDGNTFNDKKTFLNLLPYDLQMDMQADIQVPVYGSSTLNILLFMGPILNPAQILDSKTKGL